VYGVLYHNSELMSSGFLLILISAQEFFSGHVFINHRASVLF